MTLMESPWKLGNPTRGEQHERKEYLCLRIFDFPIQPVIGASIEEALAAAERWIDEPKDLPAVTGEAEKRGEESSE